MKFLKNKLVFTKEEWESISFFNYRKLGRNVACVILNGYHLPNRELGKNIGVVVLEGP